MTRNESESVSRRTVLQTAGALSIGATALARDAEAKPTGDTVAFGEVALSYDLSLPDDGATYPTVENDDMKAHRVVTAENRLELFEPFATQARAACSNHANVVSFDGYEPLPAAKSKVVTDTIPTATVSSDLRTTELVSLADSVTLPTLKVSAQTDTLRLRGDASADIAVGDEQVVTLPERTLTVEGFETLEADKAAYGPDGEFIPKEKRAPETTTVETQVTAVPTIEIRNYGELEVAAADLK